MSYKVLEHLADLKIQASGKDLKELFSGFVKAIADSSRPKIVEQEKVERKIEKKAESIDFLLIDFLNEILSLSDLYNEVYCESQFEVLKENQLVCVLKGYKVKGFGLEIKGATWHDLKIEKQGDLWKAEVLFDI